MGRMLDEMESNAYQWRTGARADPTGLMSTMSRRGGGLQSKVRGLRELLGSLKINYDAALKAASTPVRADDTESADQP